MCARPCEAKKSGSNLRNDRSSLPTRFHKVGMRDLLNEIGRGIMYPGFAPKVVLIYRVIKLKDNVNMLTQKSNLM